jgi:protein gp37
VTAPVVAAATTTHDRAFYAERIRDPWRRTVEGIIEAGYWLARSKKALPADQWRGLVKEDLRVSIRTAQRLITIADRFYGSSLVATHGSRLPQAWRTLDQLTGLPERLLLAKIETGELTPETQRRDVERWKDEAKPKPKPSEPEQQPSGNAEGQTGDDKSEQPEPAKPYITLEAWKGLSESERHTALATTDNAKLNKQQNESIGWAKWSWNPITGCRHDCPYCYARDFAERFYEQGFEPTLHPDRLTAPQNMTVRPTDDPASRNVFTGSMSDMFGNWVPEEWIEAVMASVRRSPELNFLFLTKFPQRMIDRDVPPNVWLGSTVDRQSRVKVVEYCFAQCPARTRWLSLEPLLEPLKFNRPELFTWVVIGGASRSTQTPEWQPPFEWVIDLCQQFRATGAAIYFKDNLGIEGSRVPREFPWQSKPPLILPKEFGLPTARTIERNVTAPVITPVSCAAPPTFADLTTHIDRKPFARALEIAGNDLRKVKLNGS